MKAKNKPTPFDVFTQTRDIANVELLIWTCIYSIKWSESAPSDSLRGALAVRDANAAVDALRAQRTQPADPFPKLRPFTDLAGKPAPRRRARKR
jgi:hypothetical protein